MSTLPGGVVASTLARAGKAWRVRLCEARGESARWTAPAGWQAELRTFAGHVVTPAAACIEIPPRWLGDLWLIPSA